MHCTLVCFHLQTDEITSIAFPNSIKMTTIHGTDSFGFTLEFKSYKYIPMFGSASKRICEFTAMNLMYKYDTSVLMEGHAYLSIDECINRIPLS